METATAMIVGASIGLCGAVAGTAGSFVSNWFVQNKVERRERANRIRAAAADLLAQAYSLELKLHHGLTKAEYLTAFQVLQNSHHVLASLLDPQNQKQTSFLATAKRQWEPLTKGIGFNGQNVSVATLPTLPPVEEFYQQLHSILK